MNDEKTQHPDPDRWWRHRRRAFYFGLAWGVVQTPLWALLALLDAELVQALSTVIYSSYGVSFVPIVGYFSNTCVSSVVTRGAQ